MLNSSEVWQLQKPDDDVLVAEIKAPPPSTFDEWLLVNKILDWPPIFDNDGFQVTPESYGVGSQEQIVEILKKNTSFDFCFFDVILQNLEDLDVKLKKYTNLFPCNNADEDIQVVASNEGPGFSAVDAYVPCKKLLIPESSNYPKEDDSQTSSSKVLAGMKLKLIEHAVYPGFFSRELSPLPGSLEAPQILNKITKLQGFPRAYRKLWKKYFLSDASIAVFQDAFWWNVLDSLKNEDAEHLPKIFSRLARSFVVLFVGVPGQDKDVFFKHYPNCLSQAIYMAFCSAYSRSVRKFDARFRENLVTTLFEWITGARPHACSVLSSWKLNELERGDETTAVSFQDDHTQLANVSLSFDEDAFLCMSKMNQVETDVTHPSSSKKAYPKKDTKESHVIGAGGAVEHVWFNVYGRSPLIRHYLVSRNLQLVDQVPEKKVIRTELQSSFSCGPTYHQVIEKQKAESKAKRDALKILQEDSRKELLSIQNRKREEVKSISQLQDQLRAKHVDIKTLSEKILDMTAHGSTTLQQQLGDFAPPKSADKGE